MTIATFIGARKNKIAFTISTSLRLNIAITGNKWNKDNNIVFLGS